MRAVIILVSLCVVCACEQQQATELQPGDMRNPAIRFCLEQGGHYLSEGRAANRQQYCVLDDGTKVDMWEFYRDYQ
ncbi:DUF333 domain-containing protein [Pseudoalteromonas sp. BDTF-M6]|uniref:DUF333 domain-containing protein n=1 Tax=Pseudoalteromonas sp. BDTF-M6 TaxID=2796132 RepID=UPI001BAEADE1|nr:DUF333 domain-containing protein [Pseudoalteromonas sp. BDTF-M6]MBS3796810.1 DUF333 domain-containing protein [Pseudoalteromonas sp. BDTF-M6]